MSKLAILELNGDSNKKYTFNVYSYTSIFEKYGGVYCISKRKLKNDNKFGHEIFYIGETDDLSTRFSNHHKKDCFEENDVNCVSIYQMESEEERKEIEKDLIKYYKPICNDQLT